MTTRTSSNMGAGCSIGLLTLAGLLLMITGGIMAYPLLRDVLLPPASFGEARPLLRPTVTPLPVEGQTTIPATPALLPGTPLRALGQTRPPQGAAQAILSNHPSAQLPTRLVIPAINLDAPIEPVGWSQVEGSNTWDIPDHFAAGWLITSAPLGRPGNTVLDGHHNMAGEVFRHLVDLKAGDLIEVYSDTQMVVYKVTALHILLDRDQPFEVRRQNAAWIQPTLDERVTLITCWPYTNNTHRLIVVASPISPQ